MLLEISSMVLCGGATAILAGTHGNAFFASARGAFQQDSGARSAITLEMSDSARAALVEDGSPRDGFLTRLEAGDILTLTLSAEVAGKLLVLDTDIITREIAGDDGMIDRTAHALGIYVLPGGTQTPEDFGPVREADLIAQMGLVKLGAVDLGLTVTRTDPVSGTVDTLEHDRQADPPEIAANRGIVTARAQFV